MVFLEYFNSPYTQRNILGKLEIGKVNTINNLSEFNKWKMRG